jgi:anti-anti-sigma factor
MGGKMDVAGELDVRIDRSALHTVVRLAGDLDLGSCERMREAVADHLLDGPVILDMSGLGFCDSSGLRALLDIHRRAVDHRASLRLAGVGMEVNRVLELTGTLEYFDLYPDVEHALAG